MEKKQMEAMERRVVMTCAYTLINHCPWSNGEKFVTKQNVTCPVAERYIPSSGLVDWRWLKKFRMQERYNQDGRLWHPEVPQRDITPSMVAVRSASVNNRLVDKLISSNSSSSTTGSGTPLTRERERTELSHRSSEGKVVDGTADEYANILRGAQMRAVWLPGMDVGATATCACPYIYNDLELYLESVRNADDEGKLRAAYCTYMEVQDRDGTAEGKRVSSKSEAEESRRDDGGLQMRPKALAGYPEITLELWHRDIIAVWRWPEALTRVYGDACVVVHTSGSRTGKVAREQIIKQVKRRRCRPEGMQVAVCRLQEGEHTGQNNTITWTDLLRAVVEDATGAGSASLRLPTLTYLGPLLLTTHTITSPCNADTRYGKLPPWYRRTTRRARDLASETDGSEDSATPDSEQNLEENTDVKEQDNRYNRIETSGKHRQRDPTAATVNRRDES
ncbi:hypothetical protein CBL_00274 [Carabus blaptoides fortunei]